MHRSLVTAAVAGAVLFSACGSSPPQLPYGAANSTKESAAAADMSMRVANVRYELADGVTADKDKQEAYKQASASRDDAERLAKAFGVPGEVRPDEGGWSVGATGEEPASPERSTLSLYLGKNGSFSMNGHYPMSSGASCPETAERDRAADQPDAECAPTTTTTRPPTMPTEAEARQIARRTLAAAGIDVEGMKVTTEEFDLVISVRFQPLVDGRVVEGYEHGVTVNSEKGIAYGNGYVGDMNSVGTYDLATLERAVERLNEQQAAAGGDDYRTMTGDGTEPAIAPEAPGAPESSEPTVITLTAARVGLMLTFEDNGGSLWLTPAYVFTTDNHGEVLAAAADDKYLPPPTTAPAPSDTKPPVTEPAPPVAADNCVSTDAPIAAQVCSDKASYAAGETAVFRVTASDPDRAFTQGPCGDGVSVEYGDDGEGDARCLACSTSVAEGPGKLSAERKHTYAKSGTFTATFTIKSGAECGDPHPNDSSVTLSLPVRVA